MNIYHEVLEGASTFARRQRQGWASVSRSIAATIRAPLSPPTPPLPPPRPPPASGTTATVHPRAASSPRATAGSMRHSPAPSELPSTGRVTCTSLA